ncbi:MAG: DUF4406 domain-containing protein [Bacteroidaceae bacterium]|nr:DUF4406 domain-containing protein [Bacteroidaceae bacterium]
MKVYVSVPISGRPISEAKRQAESVKNILSKAGHEVITPFDVVPNPPDMPDKEQYAYCMGKDIEAILNCDAMAMCEGWMDSKGCTAERFVAIVYGKKFFYKPYDKPLIL